MSKAAETDLHRTFPDNIRFKSATAVNGEGGNRRNDVPAIQSLRRVLSAFSLYAPEIGYCQSLNYIAGLLLLFMDEEDAFWTFVVLVQDILPPNIYDVTMEGANIDQTVLMMLLSERCPHIWNRISNGKSFWECEEAEMPTITLVTSHWFLTLFINILPIEVTRYYATWHHSLANIAIVCASSVGLPFLVSLSRVFIKTKILTFV